MYERKPKSIKGICEKCGKPFMTHNSKQKYCSKDCRKEAYGRGEFSGTMANRPATGAIHELVVCVDLLRKGFQVFRNVSPVGVDLMAYRAGQAIRVEVKTAFPSIKTGEFLIPSYDPTSCEVLALVYSGKIVYLEAKTRAKIDL